MKKWLIGCMLALLMVSPALAGQDPYIAVVGNDIDANSFYLSPKYLQFTYDQTVFGVDLCSSVNETAIAVTSSTRVGGKGCEQFRSQTPLNQPEICDTTGIVNGVGDFTFYGEMNSRITANNSGFYEWFVRLPKKPNGEINLCIQCGVLKPNAFAIYDFEAIELCAAETGERVGPNCSRIEVGSEGVWNPIVPSALPKITATAIPGPFAGIVEATGNVWPAFNLTAFRNPGSYSLSNDTGAQLQDNAAIQVLNGSASSRILLKSCMDKCILVKLPVTGQINALGQVENDLEAGDVIYVKMAIPRTSGPVSGGTDIYCHSQSLRVMGIGEAPF